MSRLGLRWRVWRTRLSSELITLRRWPLIGLVLSLAVIVAALAVLGLNALSAGSRLDKLEAVVCGDHVVRVVSLSRDQVARVRRLCGMPRGKALRGAQGTTGLTGAAVAGAAGVAGANGPRGTAGRRGVRGPTGSSGQSIVGAAGARGLQGPRGPRGLMGPRGPLGPQGQPGKPGPQGPGGAAGAAGATVAQVLAALCARVPAGLVHSALCG